MELEELPYCGKMRQWLAGRYGPEDADGIWRTVEETYASYVAEGPDYGGKRNGHANAIYGGMLVFALYTALPDHPPITELQEFVQGLFLGQFTRLGKVFDLNRPLDMRIADAAFRKSGNRDRRDIRAYPDGFVAVDAPYDRAHRAARYSFTQCPNAEFAKRHGLTHVLPLLCNCDFFGISEIHGTLIRKGTCGNSPACDYCVVGDKNPMAQEYEVVTDELGFLVSRKREARP